MEHHFKGQLGSFGTGDGQFDQPRGIAVDSDGNVYVADSGNNRIQKFTSTGIFLDKWGERGNGEGQFINPIHIAVDSNNDIYVTKDLTNISSPRPLRTRIQKFTRTGDFIKQWGEAGIGDGQFDRPDGIATFSGNSLLVVDSQNHRIQEFSRDGVFITKWGLPGQFRSPTGVAINKIDDMHYISDTGNHRVQRFHWDAAVP